MCPCTWLSVTELPAVYYFKEKELQDYFVIALLARSWHGVILQAGNFYLLSETQGCCGFQTISETPEDAGLTANEFLVAQ